MIRRQKMAVPPWRYSARMGPSKVRPATASDVEAMANLCELKRAEYAGYEPEFWRPAATARLVHTPYLAYLVQAADVVTLVADAGGPLVGFFTLRRSEAPPGLSFDGELWHTDDFTVADAELWPSVGRALLDAGLATPRERPALFVAVCGHRDRPKAEILRSAGLRAECSFRLSRPSRGRSGFPSGVRLARLDDAAALRSLAEHQPPHSHAMQLLWSQTPSVPACRRLLEEENVLAMVAEIDARVVGYALGRSGLPAPPVYDPGGTTSLVEELALARDASWEVIGALLLDALEWEAGRRGDVQLLIACGREEAEKRALLDARSFRRPVDWYSRVLYQTSP